jgi:tRNA(fMet)-specific endonuclease VapC
MANQYLLDTNTASYIIKGNVPAVHRRLKRVPISQVFLSSVTEGELRYGVAKRPAATKLQRLVEEFLLRVTVLPWDSEAAKQYGQVRRSRTPRPATGQSRSDDRLSCFVRWSDPGNQ